MTQDAPLSLVRDAIVAGKYQLVAPLARGGMGAVWTATHIELGVLVAIKFIDAEQASSEVARARFAREATSAAALHHPHIVAIRDYGVDRGTPYLVMELLRGESLSTRLRREGRLSILATSVILKQISRALRVAHEAGVVHRDLKPGNIFLAQVDEEEVVKVLDFGIAKDVRAGALGDVTRTGETVGSPHYMSPEQVRGAHDLDARSDIWSLGVIVFRCLTGRLPFPGDVLGDVIAKIVSDPVPAATALAPDLPAAIDRFLARAMARDRAERFTAVRDMAAALSAIANGPPAAPISSASWSGSAAGVLAVAPVSSPSWSNPSAVAPVSSPSWSSPSAVAPVSSPSWSNPSAVAPVPAPERRERAAPTSAPWPPASGEATTGTLGGAGRSTAPRGKGRGRAAVIVVALLGCAMVVTVLWNQSPAVNRSAPAALVTASAMEADARAQEPRSVEDPLPASAPPIVAAPATETGTPVASASAFASVAVPTRPAPSPRRTPPAKKNGLPAVGF